ncbi:MAG: hypothetical protein WB710_00885 [Stellaceae bacterium]
MFRFTPGHTHFGHGGALRLYRHPFGSVAAMNATRLDGDDPTGSVPAKLCRNYGGNTIQLPLC